MYVRACERAGNQHGEIFNLKPTPNQMLQVPSKLRIYRSCFVPLCEDKGAVGVVLFLLSVWFGFSLLQLDKLWRDVMEGTFFGKEKVGGAEHWAFYAFFDGLEGKEHNCF